MPFDKQLRRRWVIGTWHWGFMAQPEPFPERLISAVPAEYRLFDRHGDQRVCALLYAQDHHRFVPRLSGHGDQRFRDGHGGQGQENRYAAAFAMGRTRPVARARQGVWKRYASTIVAHEAIECGHYIQEEVPDKVIQHFTSFFKV